MKELVIRCRFDNPLCCTGQGNRQNAISIMLNSSKRVSLNDSMIASQHKSIESYMIYERPDKEAHAKLFSSINGRCRCG